MNFFNLKNSVIDGLDTPCMGTGHLPEVKVLERTNRLPTFFYLSDEDKWPRSQQ